MDAHRPWFGRLIPSATIIIAVNGRFAISGRHRCTRSKAQRDKESNEENACQQSLLYVKLFLVVKLQVFVATHTPRIEQK